MNKKPSNARTVIAYIVLIILTFLCLFFFYILIINCTRSHAQIQSGFSFTPGSSFRQNFNNVMFDAKLPVMSGIKNSLIVSTGCAVLATYFSALTAYGLYAYNFKLKRPAFIFIMLILVMPTQVSAMGFLNLITKMGMINTLYPLILPSVAAPAIFYFMYSYMQSSLPLELVEAARIDGCNEFMTFNRIVLPIMKPALAVQAIFAFVSNWNNYFMPALVLQENSKRTLPILIASLRSADFLKFDMGKVYMLITIAIVPIIIVYIALSKYIVAGVALGGVKE
ncbi:MAG: carbohydrate ABC transporter permease [Mogibacterium sp.]|nr:carbohydrate ABC transporter permease [Mogibacterium sp.]